MKKKLKLILATKFANHRLHMAGITENKQKALFSLWSLKAGDILVRLDKNEEEIIIITTMMIIVILVTM